MSFSDSTVSQPLHGRNRTLDLQSADRNGSALHPAWQQFIGFCKDLQFGEIERLSIQDGVPVLAEEVRKKVRFRR